MTSLQKISRGWPGPVHDPSTCVRIPYIHSQPYREMSVIGHRTGIVLMHLLTLSLLWSCALDTAINNVCQCPQTYMIKSLFIVDLACRTALNTTSLRLTALTPILRRIHQCACLRSLPHGICDEERAAHRKL